MPSSIAPQGDRGIGKTALAKLIMYAAEVSDPAFHRSAEEHTRKDFSDMYDFLGKETLRETLLNILALVGRPLPTNNVYRELIERHSQPSILGS